MRENSVLKKSKAAGAYATNLGREEIDEVQQPFSEF